MQSFSWIFIYAFALPIFFILVFLLYKFVDYKLRHDNEKFAPIFETSDNVVGLSPEELKKKKAEQQEGMKQLSEAISKMPVKLVNGKFVPMEGEELQAELERRKAEEAKKSFVQITLPEQRNWRAVGLFDSSCLIWFSSMMLREATSVAFFMGVRFCDFLARRSRPKYGRREVWRWRRNPFSCLYPIHLVQPAKGSLHRFHGDRDNRFFQ